MDLQFRNNIFQTRVEEELENRGYLKGHFFQSREKNGMSSGDPLCHLEILVCHLEILICHQEILVFHLEILLCHLEILACHLEILVYHLEILVCHLEIL
jgi:hypothetical protein